MLCGDTRQHARHRSYPMLSPTFRSHQLWAPLHLERVTINERKYQQYLKTTPINPSHRLSCGGKKYGDDGFFLHKNIPIGQNYDKTLLLKSDVRPWDQTVPRPLTTGQILEKESHLSFPSQHPHTSHIPQFAVFPDSKMSTYVPPSSRLVQTAAGDSGKRNNTNIQTTGNQVYGTGETAKADAYIQTEVTCFDQSVPQFPKPMLKERTPINTVKRKAYCDGVRVEVVDTSGTSVVGNHTNKYQQPMPTLCLHPGIYRWDVSRRFAKAKGLVQSSMTYPIPSSMYSPMEHPLTTSSYPGTTGQQTFESLNSVNKRVSTSTAYNDNYSLSVGQSRKIFKRESQSTMKSAPADSRGKYAKMTQFSAVYKTEQHLQNKTHCNEATQTDDIQDEEDETEDDDNKAIESERNEEMQDSQQPVANKYHHMPPASATHSVDRESYLQPSSRGSSAYDDEGFDLLGYRQESTNTAYSKSNTMKHFHSQHCRQEIPDLRQYSISSGRRHIINGYHAYYWH